MLDVDMPAAMADTPLGGRMHAFLRHLRGEGRELTDDEVATTWSREFAGISFLRDSLARRGAQTTGFVVAGYELAQPCAGVALLRGADGRQWRACVVIEERPPHLILGSAVFPSPPGVTVREAAASDAARLREIERRTPIVVGDVKVYYDRGEDYFACERLMGDDVEMFVMERDGRLVGLGGRAFPAIRVAGNVFQGMYTHRLRLLPEAQGEGIQGPMNARRMLSGVPKRCLAYAFIAEGNEAPLRSMPVGVWPVGASRLIIETASAAGAPAGRQASAEDGRRLAELFNLGHNDEELFVPYTLGSLSTRLERARDLYTWANVRLTGRAALGVWPARLGVRREVDGTVTQDVRALVLDYGCEAGAEGELASLVRATCAELSEQGITELSIFSTRPSRMFAPLRALAVRAEPYVVACSATPGPELERRGVYVDQLYF